MFVISMSVCPCPAKSNVSGRPVACLRVEHLSGAPLGWVPALNAIMTLSWKGLPGTNTLTYYKHS